MRLLILLLPLLLLSCAQKRLIPLGNGVKVDPESYTAVYENENVRIVVRANAWDGYPSSLPDRLLPLFVEIDNRGSEELEIDKRWIALIDERGNQYNLLDPKEAAEVARSGSRVGFAFGFGFGTPHYGLGTVFGPPYDTYAEDIINRAFIPGRVLPRAKLKGFLYFQKLHDEVNRVKLRLGYKIGGRLELVEFKFRVEDGKGSGDNGNTEDREGARREPS